METWILEVESARFEQLDREFEVMKLEEKLALSASGKQEEAHLT